MTSSGPGDYSQDVEVKSYMPLAIEKIQAPALGNPAESKIDSADHRLNISVVFTSVESTLPALREAGNLANNLGARITLLVPQVVPYPLPLENSPVPVEFNERRFRVVAGRSAVETRVQIYLCRERMQALAMSLGPGSIVVLGGRKRWWWPTRDEVLAKELGRAGCEVIYKETE